jgi:hypothetical protein
VCLHLVKTWFYDRKVRRVGREIYHLATCFLNHLHKLFRVVDDSIVQDQYAVGQVAIVKRPQDRDEKLLGPAQDLLIPDA